MRALIKNSTLKSIKIDQIKNDPKEFINLARD